MSINLKIDIPLHKEYKEPFLNLDDGLVDKIYSDLNSVSLDKDILLNTDSGLIVNKKYINKNICIGYLDNISEPSISVPNSDNFRYLTKEDNEYIFSKTNPKKTEVFTPEFLNSLPNSFFNLENAIIAKELYSNNNYYKVFSLPFGGIDKNDSYFYFVDIEGKITELSADIDYAEGLIYVYYEGKPYEDPSPNITFVFCLCNLVPLKITPKGYIKIEEENSGYFKISNIPNKNYISLEDFNEGILLTTLKDILLKIPIYSNSFNIDGVTVNKDQYLFLSRNETIYITKDTLLENSNVEYLSTNTKLVNEFTTAYKEDHIVLSDTSFNDEYYIEIINKENKNTYMKQTPILIQLFKRVTYGT